MAPSTSLIDTSVESQKVTISDEDQKLINEVRATLADELKLVPGYETNESIMRWIIGWNRRMDQLIPRMRVALQNIHALRLPEQDFSSVEKIVEYCDSISEAANYLPGTLIGRDRCGNLVSLQALGHLDGHGLMKSVRISDLYISRIAESEGVMNLLRDHELKTGQQLGTMIIIDLDGLSRDAVTLASIKVISILLSQLQEMFPDVVRKILIIRAPFWVNSFWTILSPVLARQTQLKIEFLGSNWRETLHNYVDKNLLFEHWGGSRKSSNPCGNIRMGGLLPEKLHYSADKESVDLSDLDLEQINVPARSSVYLELKVTAEQSKIGWWWQTNNGDLDFYVVRCDGEKHESLVWPKFRLLTSFVPEYREIQHRGPGTYKLYFGNTHGKLFSKDVLFKTWTK